MPLFNLKLSLSFLPLPYRTASKNATFLTTLNYTGKISYLEHVVVVISISAYPRGGIQINLVSPAGTNVTLLQNRPNDIQPGKYNKWPFVSVMFWGENPSGNWTLTISNSNSSDAIITVEQCEFHGVLYTPTVVARIPEECHSDYCYDASAPVDECESPLKEKIGEKYYSLKIIYLWFSQQKWNVTNVRVSAHTHILHKYAAVKMDMNYKKMGIIVQVTVPKVPSRVLLQPTSLQI